MDATRFSSRILRSAKWKEDLGALARDYIPLGGRPAKQDRLGPVCAVSFCATGVGVPKEARKEAHYRRPWRERRRLRAKRNRARLLHLECVILHDYYTLSEDRYANVAKNKHHLYNNQKQAREAATGAPPAATDAAGAAPLSLATPAAPTTP